MDTTRTYGTFMQRLLAACIDATLLLPFVLLTVLFPLFISQYLSTIQYEKLRVALSLNLFLISPLYNIISIYFAGATVGKRIFNLRVVSETFGKPSFWRILFRETIGKNLSTWIFGLGYLMIFFSPKRQALHDRLNHTLVIRNSPQVPIKKAILLFLSIYGIYVLFFCGLVFLFLQSISLEKFPCGRERISYRLLTTALKKPNEVCMLDLSLQNLTELPRDVEQFTHLRVLRVHDNLISAIPNFVWNLAELQEIDLSNNLVQTLSPRVGLMPRLRYLDLSDNKLTDLPKELAHTKKLVNVTVRNNPISVVRRKELEKLLWNGGKISALFSKEEYTDPAENISTIPFSFFSEKHWKDFLKTAQTAALQLKTDAALYRVRTIQFRFNNPSFRTIFTYYSPRSRTSVDIFFDDATLKSMYEVDFEGDGKRQLFPEELDLLYPLKPISEAVYAVGERNFGYVYRIEGVLMKTGEQQALWKVGVYDRDGIRMVFK